MAVQEDLEEQRKEEEELKRSIKRRKKNWRCFADELNFFFFFLKKETLTWQECVSAYTEGQWLCPPRPSLLSLCFSRCDWTRTEWIDTCHWLKRKIIKKKKNARTKYAQIIQALGHDDVMKCSHIFPGRLFITPPKECKVYTISSPNFSKELSCKENYKYERVWFFFSFFKDQQ